MISRIRRFACGIVLVIPCLFFAAVLYLNSKNRTLTAIPAVTPQPIPDPNPVIAPETVPVITPGTIPDNPTVIPVPDNPTMILTPDSPTMIPDPDSPTMIPDPDSPTIRPDPMPDSPAIAPEPVSEPNPVTIPETAPGISPEAETVIASEVQTGIPPETQSLVIADADDITPANTGVHADITAGDAGVYDDTAVVTVSAENWGLSFPVEGETPLGNATQEDLSTLDAFFHGDTSRKVLYLTFDCGYENGNTIPILDTLQKHHAPGAFFVVGNMLQTAPDIVKRMADDGHIVGNHTYHHPDMSAIADMESFEQELAGVEDLYREITGRELSHYYRPPQGKYSRENLKQAQALGYQTIFWSLAYVDWYQDNQPTREQAFAKLLPRIHNGAIVLLHSTSGTNAQILDELLTRWEEMGFTFGTLDELGTSGADEPETHESDITPDKSGTHAQDKSGTHAPDTSTDAQGHESVREDAA